MIKGGNSNLFYALGRFRKNCFSQRNVNDVIAQLHSTQEQNAANQVTADQLMGVANGIFKNIHDQGEVGNKKTHLLEQQRGELSKVISEEAIGKFETNVQTRDMSECRIEKGVDSRNMRSVGKSDVGNPTTN